MKIVIEAEGVKREIRAPLGMCMSQEDAWRLVDILHQHFGTRDVPGSSPYGWVEVHPRIEQVPNTPPLPWKDRAKPYEGAYFLNHNGNSFMAVPDRDQAIAMAQRGHGISVSNEDGKLIWKEGVTYL